MAPLVANKEPELPQWLLQNKAIEKARDKLLDASVTNQIFKHIGHKQTANERDVATAYGDVAKVSCSDLAMENCQKSITLMGKGGLRHENGTEKLLRDVKLLQIYEGTNQVNMLDFIKRRLMNQFSTNLSR